MKRAARAGCAGRQLGGARARPGMDLDVYRDGGGGDEAGLTDNDEDIAHLGLDGVVCR